MNKQRIISFDILKIMCMIMVVILHLASYGIQNISIEFMSVPYCTISILKSFSIVAVNCFVLISGYFLCQSDIRLKKATNLWIQVETYSIGIYLVLVFVPGSGVHFSIQQLIKHTFPLLTNQYWFFTYYILLFLIAPMLNIFIRNVEQAQFKRCLFILIIIFSVVPTCNIFNDNFGTNSGYSLLWFIVLYLIASYIRLYSIKGKYWGHIYIILSIILLCIQFLGDSIGHTISIFSYIKNLAFQYNSLFVLGASVALFMATTKSKLHFSNNKINLLISNVASLSFAVYLFHENSSFRNYLWNNIVDLRRFINSEFYFLLMVPIFVFSIFGAGIVIEIVRRGILKFFEKDRIKFVSAK